MSKFLRKRESLAPDIRELLGDLEEREDNLWDVHRVSAAEFEAWRDGKLTTLQFFERQRGNLDEFSHRLGQISIIIREAGFAQDNEDGRPVMERRPPAGK